MKYYYIYLVAIVLTCKSFLHADLGADWSNFTSTMSGIGSGFKQFGEGMAESFGMAPSGHHYSFKVFNNTVSDTVTVQANNLKKIQGVVISTGNTIGDTVTLAPGADTGNSFSHIGLYLEAEIKFLKGSYTQDIVNAMDTYKDPSDGLPDPVFLYNVYTQVYAGSAGRIVVGPQVEMIGVTGPNSLANGSKGSYIGLSSDFSGLIYNSVDQLNSVTFSYRENSSRSIQYTVQLDPLSYNFLNNDRTLPHAIRPESGTVSLTFTSNGAVAMGSQNSIILQSQGFANGVWDNTNHVVSTSDQASGPLRCNYEIINNNGLLEVVQTGFNPGNYLVSSANPWSILPITLQTRSITPVRCLIWNQSADQYKKQLTLLSGSANNQSSITIDPTSGTAFVPVDLPGKSLWFVYYAPGWKTAQTSDGVLYGQIPLGQAVGFSFIRPPLSYKCSLTAKESVQWTIGNTTTQITSAARLSIVSLDTTDAKKAEKFLRNLASEKILFSSFTPPTASNLLAVAATNVVAQKLPVNSTYLTDSDSQVTGILLASDIFSSYESSSGPFYYTIYPAQGCIQIPVQLLANTLNTSELSTSDQQAALMNTVAQWLTTGVNSIESVKPLLMDYMQKNSVDQMFAVNGSTVNKNNLSILGSLTFDQIVYGPGGIKNPSLFWMAGINNFVYTQTNIPQWFAYSNGQNAATETVTWNPTSVTYIG